MLDKVKTICGKLFIGGLWKVAYRLRDSNDSIYKTVEAPEGMWIADPLLYEDQGQHYLFVELFNQKLDKAGIGYYQFIDGKPVFQKQIIEQPFHLSYPCVFLWHDEHYMIPESAAGRTLDLYRAIHFPDEWTLDSHLLYDMKYVDTTIVQQEGKLYALAYHQTDRKWKLTVFRLDMTRKKLERITEETFQRNTGRPAGYVLQDEMIRPAQDCSRQYGEAIIWYQIDEINDSVFREHPVGRLCVADLAVQEKADRVHTYSRDSLYEAVDLRFGKFDLFHGLKTIRRSVAGAKGAKS